MGHRWVNVFYVQLTHTATVTVNDLKTLADYVGANYPPASSGGFPTTMSLSTVDVSFIPSTGNVLDYTGTYTNVGTGGTAVADVSACHVIDYVIAARYRGGHPRAYLPGVIAADVTNGSDVSSSRQTATVNVMNTLRNGIDALTSTNITAMSMGTVHYQRGNAWLSPPTFDPYTSLKYGNGGKIGSQRRRIHS